MSDDGVADGQQFAHAGNEGDLLAFACGDEPLIQRTDDGVVAHGGTGGHVQHRAHRSATTPDAARAFPLAAVTIERRHTHQRGELSVIDAAQ